jgi:protein-L-isoaspartate(D-aspartate) O-methyltransferase
MRNVTPVHPVTASLSPRSLSIFKPLLDQLKPGGRMVIPVGGRYDAQELLLITWDGVGVFHRKNIEPVRFVPPIGEH